MTSKAAFTLTCYGATLTRLVTGPGRFFRDKKTVVDGWHALGFLVLSCLIFTGAGLLYSRPEKPVLVGGISFVNGVAMAFVTALVGYGLMVMLVGRKTGFGQFFSVIALSSGATMLISWVPYALWFTSLWKWGLIATGLWAGIGLRKRDTGMIVVLSMVILFAIFRSLLPLLS